MFRFVRSPRSDGSAPVGRSCSSELRSPRSDGNLAAGGEVAQHRGQLAEVGWHRSVGGELTGQGDIGARRNTDRLGGGVGLCRAGDGGAARGNRQNGRRREAEGGDDGGTSPHVHSCGAAGWGRLIPKWILAARSRRERKLIPGRRSGGEVIERRMVPVDPSTKSSTPSACLPGAPRPAQIFAPAIRWAPE